MTRKRKSVPASVSKKRGRASVADGGKSDAVDAVAWSRLKMADLRRVLGALGAGTQGNKADLVDHLEKTVGKLKKNALRDAVEQFTSTHGDDAARAATLPTTKRALEARLFAVVTGQQIDDGDVVVPKRVLLAEPAPPSSDDDVAPPSSRRGRAKRPVKVHARVVVVLCVHESFDCRSRALVMSPSRRRRARPPRATRPKRRCFANAQRPIVCLCLIKYFTVSHCSHLHRLPSLAAARWRNALQRCVRVYVLCDCGVVFVVWCLRDVSYSTHSSSTRAMISDGHTLTAATGTPAVSIAVAWPLQPSGSHRSGSRR